ncbi:MAG: DUF1801 domain-containing protein [Xanthomonadales bacterium]|nr:DUF1801 domain-containing protein [Xanthomonadales bacterium]
MAGNKTHRNTQSVDTYLASVDNEQRRRDSLEVLEMMRDITGMKPEMWGSSMVGFGSYHYRYDSGREGDWFLTGFAPRKQALTLYIMDGFAGQDALMEKLGKHKTGKSCLYINKLDDIHRPTLRQLIRKSVTHLKKKYDA